MVHGLETMAKLNAEQPTGPAIRSVVVANSIGLGDQALYVDGEFKLQEDTIYAHDITTSVGGPTIPFTLDQWDIDDLEGWPKTIDELRAIMVEEKEAAK